MQDRYVGDIGDFGKLGFLRALEIAGLSLGVNWYYTTPSGSEKIQGDGRHLIDQKYFDCDQNLASTLYKLSKSPSTSTGKRITRELASACLRCASTSRSCIS